MSKPYEEMDYEERAVFHADRAFNGAGSDLAMVDCNIANTYALLNSAQVQSRVLAALTAAEPVGEVAE